MKEAAGTVTLFTIDAINSAITCLYQNRVRRSIFTFEEGESRV